MATKKGAKSGAGKSKSSKKGYKVKGTKLGGGPKIGGGLGGRKKAYSTPKKK